jgi:hypothetical protein
MIAIIIFRIDAVRSRLAVDRGYPRVSRAPQRAAFVSEVGLGHRAAAMGLKAVPMERIHGSREGADWVIDFFDW